MFRESNSISLKRFWIAIYPDSFLKYTAKLFAVGIRFGQVFKRAMFFCSLFATFEC